MKNLCKIGLLNFPLKYFGCNGFLAQYAVWNSYNNFLFVSIVTIARNEAESSIDDACEATTEKHHSVECVLNCACIKKRSSLDTIAVIIAKRLILTVVSTDELVDAIPIIINILNVCSHDTNQHDGTEERKQSRSDLPFIAKQSKCKWHHQTSLNA